jgi:hypothetical protein
VVKKVGCESVRSWGFSHWGVLEGLIIIFLGNWAHQSLILFLGDLLWDVLDERVYILSAIYRMLRNKVPVVSQNSRLYIYMILNFQALIRDKMSDEIILVALKHQSMEKISVSLPLFEPLDTRFFPPHNFFLLPSFC